MILFGKWTATALTCLATMLTLAITRSGHLASDPLFGHLVATTAFPLSNRVARFTPGTAHAHIFDSPALITFFL
jgi:hypothetical protein